MKIRLDRALFVAAMSGLLILTVFFAKEDNYAYSCTYEEALNSDWTGYDLNDVIRILNEDVTVPTELTPEQRKACLIGEMKDFYEEFNKNSDKIKYEALTAISALETGYFSSEVCNYYNNVGGMRNSNGYSTYSSKEEGIEALSDLLTEEYLSKEGSYYEGTKIVDIGKHFNPSVHWVNMYVKVRLDMEERAEKVEPKQNVLICKHSEVAEKRALRTRVSNEYSSPKKEEPFSIDMSIDSIVLWTALLPITPKVIH